MICLPEPHLDLGSSLDMPIFLQMSTCKKKWRFQNLETQCLSQLSKVKGLILSKKLQNNQETHGLAVTDSYHTRKITTYIIHIPKGLLKFDFF